MQGQNVAVADANEMWTRLFDGHERWGWEFTPPALPVVSPEAAYEPVAEQVYAPHDFQFRQRRAKRAWLGLIGYLVATFFAVAFTGSILKPAEAKVPGLVEWATSIVLAIGVVLAVVTFIGTRRRFSKMKRNYDSQYNGAVQRYNEAYAAWRSRIDEHNRMEAHRFTTAMLWHPVQLTSRPSRIDVFGGTEDGWASLLTTIGAAQLASGSSLMLLDFTDMAVGDNLAYAAASQGHDVAVREAPRDLAEIGLLAGLDPAELAEVLAESMHNLNRSAMSADLRGLHIDLLTATAERLTDISFVKLVAGLQVLRRVYDAGTDETLAADELRKLNSYVDTVGNTDQVRNELQALEGELRVLARAEQEGKQVRKGDFRTIWPVRGFSVVSTKARTGRHRRFLDHVVFHRTLQELHSRHASGRETLVVAGADQIGLEALEAMARQARRSGVRLIFLIQHLRDDLRKLLGAGGTVSLLMQLGNGEEAAAAAEFIGREHKVVMSQLTVQVGETLTHGSSSTEGGSSSTSHSDGYTWGGSSTTSWGPNGSDSSSSSWSRTSSTANTRENNWSDTVNQSEAKSQTVGETAARVYEFDVEPTVLQGLAPTAFVLIETGPAGRRVVTGDCNPGIVLLDRVALRARQS